MTEPMESGRVFACKDCPRVFRSMAALGGHRSSHTLRRQQANGYRLPKSKPQPEPDHEKVVYAKPIPEPRQPVEGPVQWPSWPIERRPFDPEKVKADQRQAELDLARFK